MKGIDTRRKLYLPVLINEQKEIGKQYLDIMIDNKFSGFNNQNIFEGEYIEILPADSKITNLNKHFNKTQVNPKKGNQLIKIGFISMFIISIALLIYNIVLSQRIISRTDGTRDIAATLTAIPTPAPTEVPSTATNQVVSFAVEPELNLTPIATPTVMLFPTSIPGPTATPVFTLKPTMSATPTLRPTATPTLVPMTIKISEIITDKSSPQQVGTEINISASLTNNANINFRVAVRNIKSERWNNITTNNTNSAIWIPKESGDYIVKVSIYDVNNNLLDERNLKYIIEEKPDGWIYFINDKDNNKLYKMRTNGKDIIKINEDSSTNITIYGDWIYFINESDNYYLYKIRKNGTDPVRIVKEAICPRYYPYYSNGYKIQGENIYYLTKDVTQSKLCRVSINGDDKEQLGISIGNFDIDNDNIYFENNNNIYKRSLNDGETSQILYGHDITRIQIIDEWIYYCAYDEHIYRVKKDGSIDEHVSPGRRNFVVEDDWIYPPGDLQKINKNNLEKIDIFNDTVVDLDVAKGWVYCSTYNHGLCKVKTDGSKVIEFADYEPRELIVELE